MKATACLILLLFACSVSGLYNCKRPNGPSCNGDCNADGTCTNCANGYEGYDCSVFTTGKDQGACSTTTCENGGTCYIPDGGTAASCLCTEKYSGPTCTVKRYEVTCNGDDTMTIVVRPQVQTFSGTITVEGQTDAGCTDNSNPPTLTNIANSGGPCGNTDDVTVGANTAKKRYIILRFMDPLTTNQDERITFTCGTGDTVSVATPAAVDIVFVSADLDAVSEGQVPSDTDVTFEILEGSAAPTGPVQLGTVLTVKADISAAGLASEFKKIRLETCTVASAQLNTDSNYVEKKFLDNSCPNELAALMGDFVTVDKAVSFPFDAFKFTATTELWITCIIKVCQTATDCDPLSCDGGTTNTGYGRKKREASSVEKILQRHVTVKDPLVAAAETLKELQTTKDCYQTWEMTATVVSLAVALVIVLLICILLIVKAVLDRRSRRSYREDTSETGSTAHFPHLPTIVSNKA